MSQRSMIGYERSPWMPLIAIGVVGMWMVSLAACSDQPPPATQTPEPTTTQPADGHDHDPHDYERRAHDHDEHAGQDRAMARDTGRDTNGNAFIGDPYPLAMCPVSGQPLDSMGGPVSYVHEDREIKFCCASCDSTFEADPAAHLAAIDEQIIAERKTDYPHQVCPISGAELGSMGEPVDHVWHNRLVRFCCPPCIEEFEAEPAAHLAKLDAADEIPGQDHQQNHGH